MRLWEEEIPSIIFLRLLANINSKTPLGFLIEIRSEDNKDVLKNFNKDQLRIRSEWREKHGAKQTEQEFIKQNNKIKEAFYSMM